MSDLGVKIMSVFLARRIFLGISFLFFTSICFASDESVEKGIKDKLLVISPEMPIDVVGATEIPWLFQVLLKACDVQTMPDFEVVLASNDNVSELTQ